MNHLYAPGLLLNNSLVYSLFSHGKPVAYTYKCPRCKSIACALPTDCSVCGLKLIASPHLARSYHHLFPVDAFVDYDSLGITRPPTDLSKHQTTCFACHCPFHQPDLTSSVQSPTAQTGAVNDIQAKKFKCTQCHHLFCYDCDIFIHEILHSCPGCC